jgi:hypothetical protein
VKRFLKSFETQRFGTTLNEQAPLKWLTSPKAETRKVDPHIDFKEVRSVYGVIQNVSEEEAKDLSLLVRIAAGQIRRFLLRRDLSTEDMQNGNFHYFGHARSGRLYPPGYLPSDPEKWLIGRQVRAVTYQHPHQRRTVLWLEDK